MKCPACGAEIPEGSLYCEKCGEDIHIVPDFEAEVDALSRREIEKITDEIRGELPNRPEEEEEPYEKSEDEYDEEFEEDPGDELMDGGIFSMLFGGGRRKTGLIWVGIGFLAMVALILGALLYFHFSSQDSSLLDAARVAAEEGDYESAIAIYWDLLDADPSNYELMEELLALYERTGDEEALENLLWQIVRAPEITQTQYFTAYEKLVAIYETRDDLQGIEDFLVASGNAELQAHFAEYLVGEVAFDLPGGYYEGALTLHLEAEDGAEIYYRVDDGDAEPVAVRYEGEIFLGDGDYEVRAYAVDLRGVRGPESISEYHISAQPIEAPNVIPKSGSYRTPLFIEIAFESDAEEAEYLARVAPPEESGDSAEPAGEASQEAPGADGPSAEDEATAGPRIYYTTDGTEPDEGSNLYTGKLPMPLGISRFRFVWIEESGRRSEITDREYELNLSATVSTDDATRRIVAHFGEGAAVTTELLYALHFEVIGDYYIYRVYATTPGAAGPVQYNIAVKTQDGAVWLGDYDENGEWYFLRCLRMPDGSEPEGF